MAKSFGFSRFLLAILLPLCLLNCQKKVSTGICKTNADCLSDATGKTSNGVCYMGKCEECVEDSDCTMLKQCVKNRCLQSCETNADCGENAHCEENFCIANCLDNSYCPGGQECYEGRCITKEAMNKSPSLKCQGLERLHFEFDRYDISEIYYKNLANLAACLEENPSSGLIIEGHADNRGTPAYNMALSEKRANAVKDYLVKRKGIASIRIKTVPYGEGKPLMDEENEYAFKQNRRAEFLLQN